MGKNIHIIAHVFIVTQAILITLISTFFLSEQYMTQWKNYPNTSQSKTIYLKDVEQSKQMETQQYLLQTANEQHLLIVREDPLLDNDGYSNGYKVGVAGDSTAKGATLSFLGEDVLNAENLGKLLASKDQSSTLGVGTGSINSIGTIPCFNFGGHIVVEKMSALISESTTVNGTYSVLGLDDNMQTSKFIGGLSQESGLSQTALVTQKSGSNVDDSFQRDILIAFIAANIFLNIILFLVIVVKRLPEEGTLLLLGWSRASFALKVFGKFLITAIIGTPVFIGIGWLLSGWNKFSAMLLSYYFMAAVVNLILVGIETVLSSVVIMTTKSLDAIRRRFSTKPLYILGILAYLLVSAGLVAAGCYVDQPLQTISENAQTLKNWSKVSDYQMLRSLSVGQDSASVSGQSNQLNQDVYNWYKSIADRPGVFLIQTHYYDRSLLDDWKINHVYKVIPEKPLWYFVMSPNYISNLGIKISANELSEAESGKRLYLLPSTLSSTERDKIMAWARESASDTTGSIKNKFIQHPDFAFAVYTPKTDLFTWASDSKTPTTASAPVIFVCTPENMGFIEGNSLRANGFNGYIKFANSKVMKQYTSNKQLSPFNLVDNNLTFTSVQKYIDGLQKDLLTTIEWFGLLFAFLFVLLAGLLITLATIYRVANQEKINVKKFLGFSFWELYNAPTIMLLSVTVLEVGISIALRSKFGTLLMIAASLMQLLIFVKYMTRNEFKRILIAFKGGA